MSTPIFKFNVTGVEMVVVGGMDSENYPRRQDVCLESVSCIVAGENNQFRKKMHRTDLNSIIFDYIV